MPGSENKILEYSYSEPYSTMCPQTTPWGGSYHTPCIKTRHRKTGVFVGYNYPVLPGGRPITIRDPITGRTHTISTGSPQYIQIHKCAEIAVAQAKPIIAGAIPGGPAAVAAAIKPANEVLRKTFFECLNQSGVSPQAKRESNIGIYQKRLE